MKSTNINTYKNSWKETQRLKATITAERNIKTTIKSINITITAKIKHRLSVMIKAQRKHKD